MTAEERSAQLTRGWVRAWLRDDGVWDVSFEPHEGDPEYPGATYTATDDLRPGDFPTEYDPETLLEWARREVVARCRRGSPRPA
jgi:hypothetical protein